MTTMERQQRIPMIKVVRIAVRSLRIRWWRSILVTSGIILAVAFLAYTFCSNEFAQQAPLKGSPELLASMRASGVLGDTPDTNAQVQTWWLVGLALLIAFVGILNSMIMSVTERFREIGTMKCLGALNTFIIKLFLLESLFQGIAGTLIGIVIGVMIVYAEGLASYGFEVFGFMEMLTLLGIVGICFVTGCLLTVLGAMYPAWTAARMQPIDAMRTEV